MQVDAPDFAGSSSPPWFPPKSIWILGAGQFGFIAAQRLSRRHPRASFLVVDQRGAKLERIKEALKLPVHQQDAISFIGKNGLCDEIWIIPAIPVHVAFQWMFNQLTRMGRIVHQLAVPEAVDAQIPNPYRVATGSVYPSFATFLCPDVCSEPDEICTHTGQPRSGNLFENLAQIKVAGFDVVVVRSWQLAPGVGGYPAGCLKKKFDAVALKAGAYLIATSCRCHGVIDALSW